jgi:putative peptidoglycan lipid II flippase
MLPHSIATVSIATAYFTKMSHHVQENRIDLLKNDLAAGLRTISMVSVLATAAIIVLAYPIARVFVGEYPSLVALGNVLIALIVGLLPFSFVFMMQRAFYALEDTRTPFIFTCVQIALHITGSITMSIVVPHEWLVFGLSLLTSVTVTVQALLAYNLLRRRVGSLKGLHIFTGTGYFAISGLVAGLIGYVVLQLIGGTGENAFAVKSILTAGLGSVMVGFVILAVYLVLLKLFRIREIDTALASIKGILRR